MSKHNAEIALNALEQDLRQLANSLPANAEQQPWITVAQDRVRQLRAHMAGVVDAEPVSLDEAVDTAGGLAAPSAVTLEGSVTVGDEVTLQPRELEPGEVLAQAPLPEGVTDLGPVDEDGDGGKESDDA